MQQGDDDSKPEGRDRLRLDRLFATWQDDARRPSTEDLVSTAWTALDGGVDSQPSGGRDSSVSERCVASRSSSSPRRTLRVAHLTWEGVFAALTPEDRERAEQLLGNDSLDELLE